MELRKYVIAVAAVPIVLLLMGPQAQAYWGVGLDICKMEMENGTWVDSEMMDLEMEVG
jgi:hypothetical protein